MARSHGVAGVLAVGSPAGQPVAGVATLQATVALVRSEAAALRRLRVVQALPLRLRDGTGEILGVG